MSRYIATKLSDKQIIANYIRDRYKNPKYQLCSRKIFHEVMWEHWIQNEIIFLMEYADDDRSAIEILNDLSFQMADCVSLSKTQKARVIFETAFSEIENCIDLLNAKGG